MKKLTSSKSIILIVNMLVVILFFSCQDKKTVTFEEILAKSIAAQGGEKLDMVKSITYDKNSILYLEDGSIENESFKRYTNTFHPEETTRMEWVVDGVKHKVVLTKEGIYNQDTLVVDPDHKKRLSSSFRSANYVFYQPHRLVHDNDLIQYDGTDTIMGRDAHVLKVPYTNDDGSPGNIWWFYVDTKTYKVLANLIYHEPTYALVENLEVENKTGMSLHAHRKTYRVDSLRNKKFLRGEYDYKIIEVQMKE